MTSPLALMPILFSKAARRSQSFQHSQIVIGSIPDVVARLRASIEASDLWVLHEIDPQMLVARGGYEIAAARQILFFHPALMARLLAADSAAMIEAPLKFALTDAGNGNVVIRWSDQIAAFARYGDVELAGLGQDLAATCDTIIAQLLDY